LRDKLARLYLDAIGGESATASRVDANRLLAGKAIRPGTVDVVLTSPPYLRVVNYGTANWIRLWWLGLDDVGRQRGAGRISLDAELDHQHKYEPYREFILKMLLGIRRVMKKQAVAAVVIGDVATPEGPSWALASQLWDDIGDRTGLRLLDLIEDSLAARNKVSRIWGETRGRATDRDCVMVLARADGEPATNVPNVDWDEPYKDGGPDAAHERLARRRLHLESASRR
jgi:site-specific DNA-methyltransferase (adenine-specific)